MNYIVSYNNGNSFPYMTNVVVYDEASRQFRIKTNDKSLNETLLNVKIHVSVGYTTRDEFFDILLIYKCYVSELIPYRVDSIN